MCDILRKFDLANDKTIHFTDEGREVVSNIITNLKLAQLSVSRDGSTVFINHCLFITLIINSRAECQAFSISGVKFSSPKCSRIVSSKMSCTSG